MPSREGVVRRYVLGLVMEAAPSYRRSQDATAATQALPGTLVRTLVPPHRTGAVALQQALALLTGRRVQVPTVSTAAAMARHARRHLTELRVELAWEQQPSSLLVQCQAAVAGGGVAMLQWRALPRKTDEDAFLTPAPAPRWVLVAGVEAPWHAGGTAEPAEGDASALLVLDATVPPVWGTGHNRHLTPGAPPDHAQARRVGLYRPVWTARTLDGGLECGLVTTAVVLRSPLQWTPP